MEQSLSLIKLRASKLSPDQFVLLYLLYYKDFNGIVDIYGKERALAIRNELLESDYILSDETVKFTETILSKKHVEKLFDIRASDINFWEFYNCYPIKVGTRVLRAAGPNSQLALKHEKKYLSRVKSLKDHQFAIKCIEAFVAKKKIANELRYLPNMETVLNNSLWEQWSMFVSESGKEELEWNQEAI